MEQLSINDILSELKNNSESVSKGPFLFKELTLKQQRQILNSTHEAVEIPARISNIYNDYISESVSFKDDIVKVDNFVTIDKKPLLLNILRVHSLGPDYIKDDDEDEENSATKDENSEEKKIVYKLYEVTDEDLTAEIEPITVEKGNISIQLRVPTIAIDRIYNSLLMNALKPFRKKKISDADLGGVTDMYQMYEFMKYIDSISFKGATFKIDALGPQDKITLLDRLPRSISDSILNFMKKVKKSEEKALTAYNAELDEKTVLDINTLFFSKGNQ